MELEKKILQGNPVLQDMAPETPQSLSSPLQKYLEEKKFSKEEYQNIIEGAELLRQIDAQKGKRVEDLLGRFPAEEKCVPLSRIYALAHDLDIDAKYVEKYMSLRFPSAEQQWRDLQEHNIEISDGQISDIYQIELKKSLVQAFPHESFRCNHGFGYYFYRIDKQLKRGIFGRKKFVEVPKNLASMHWDHSYNKWVCYLTISDPSFLRVVSPTLARLKETFPNFPLCIETNYSLELPHPSSLPKKSS